MAVGIESCTLLKALDSVERRNLRICSTHAHARKFIFVGPLKVREVLGCMIEKSSSKARAAAKHVVTAPELFHSRK